MDKSTSARSWRCFADHWNPRVVGELNGQHVKLVKFQGEFGWHDHAAEDELFLVVRGSFRMDFRAGLWLAVSGLQANGPMTAPGGDFFDRRKHGSSEAPAAMTIAHIHALYFYRSSFHRPRSAANHGEIRNGPDKEHTARAAETRGIDSMDWHAWVARSEITIESGDQIGGV